MTGTRNKEINKQTFPLWLCGQPPAHSKPKTGISGGQ